ncbi:MAG: hypothetical protein EXR05_02395 [Acetobacteraceae bacterium]|nr:hypothetical protein [Acetobacteraceae bacterium]
MPALGKPGPQRVLRLHGGDRRCACNGDGAHALHRRLPERYRQRDRSGGGTDLLRIDVNDWPQRHHLVPRRYHDACAPDGGAIRRYRHRHRPGRAKLGPREAWAARSLGHEPRVALISHSIFGNQLHTDAEAMPDAVRVLDGRSVDFEYDGEMSLDVALEPSLRALYPFCCLIGPANILIVPGQHSAHITSQLAPRLGGRSTIGPLLIGLTHPAQSAQLDSSMTQVVDLACLAAHQAIR